jgi:hypothetical protein
VISVVNGVNVGRYDGVGDGWAGVTVADGEEVDVYKAVSVAIGVDDANAVYVAGGFVGTRSHPARQAANTKKRPTKTMCSLKADYP